MSDKTRNALLCILVYMNTRTPKTKCLLYFPYLFIQVDYILISSRINHRHDIQQ